MNRLDHMLRAESIAVIGASERSGSVGDQTVRQLRMGGFRGAIHLVNPGHDTLHGLRCYSSVDEIGEPIDLAILALGNDKLETETENAIGVGARSLAIFASCHGAASDGGPLRDRIAALADDAGVPICGGNGMGFLNVEDGLRVCGFYQPEALPRGGITFLSHSGSLFSAMLHSRRGLGFNLVVSTGLELNTTMGDYMMWSLRLDSTRVVALFMETVRDPDRFVEALSTARDLEVPVVALKVGASIRGGAAVATHSGALAGADAAYEALFDAYGVHRVLTMDELADTVELLAAPRPAHRGGLGAVHDSGGERALLIDTADRVGVPLPGLSPSTVTRLTGLLDPGLEPANPVDAWGTGKDAKGVFAGCLDALAEDPAIGVVAFSVDLTTEDEADDTYGGAVIEAAGRTPKPMTVLAHLATTVDLLQASRLRAAGVPVLHGTETGLRAIRHLIERADRLAWPSQQPRVTTSGPVTDSNPISLLDRYGIPIANSLAASDVDEVTEASSKIGFPVVLKTKASDHKSDVGGVILDIADETDLVIAYREMASRLGPTVTVSKQIEPGVEIGLGMVADPQFGPVVLVSAGGTLIELLRDRVALLPPVDGFRARRAIERLSMSPMLSGHRGSQPSDIAGLADVVVRFSEMSVDVSGMFSSIDLNPVIVGPSSAVTVDFLFEEQR